MSEIQYIEGITITVGAAAVLVDVINFVEKHLQRQNGQPLPSKLSLIRRDFKDCITRAAANADVSTKAVSPQSVLAFDKDVNDAAEALGITTGGVRWAFRNGKLGGKKKGRQWLTSDEEIEMYRNTHQRQAVS